MEATTLVLEELQRELKTIEVLDSRLNQKLVCNGSHVLFTKSVTYKSRKTVRDVFDEKGICTEVGNATRVIRNFFNQKCFHDYTLGFNLGNAKHDMAVFVRKNNGIYEVVHFDPNGSAISRTMDEFVNVSRKGYHPRSGNPNEICSYLSWMELLKFVLCAKNPFMIRNLFEYDEVEKTYYTTLDIENLRMERNEKANAEYRKGKTGVENRILRRLDN